MRPIDLIVIHCSATPEGKHFDLEDIDRMHKARGFAMVGYHYIVLLDGTVQKGRPDAIAGAHVQGFNKHSIGICYIGGIADGKAKDTRTDEQKAALEKLVKGLRTRFPKARICGHRDLSPDLDRDGKVEPHEWMKQCPSFDVAAWLGEIGL